MFGSELQKMKSLGVRGCLDKGLQLATVAASCLMLWKGLALVTNSVSPIVVVLSGSMEPAFYRGDLLILTNFAGVPYEVGNIVVYNIPGEGIPIVHRVIETHDIANTQPLDQLLLTKGDNNALDDVGLYRGELWLKKSNVVGQVRGFIPYIGYATIVNDFPWLKNVMLGGMGLLALLQG